MVKFEGGLKGPVARACDKGGGDADVWRCAAGCCDSDWDLLVVDVEVFFFSPFGHFLSLHVLCV